MPEIIIPQSTVEALARQFLPPHLAEWYLLQRYGNSDRGIPDGLTYRVLATRIKVNTMTLHRGLKHAEEILLPHIRAEYDRLKVMPILEYVRQSAPDCVSYSITLAEGHKTRTVIDNTQRKALRGKK